MRSTEGIRELTGSRRRAFYDQELGADEERLGSCGCRKLQAADRKDDVVTFEELGVDRLYVDEAHSLQEPVPLHQNAQRRRSFHLRCAEILGYAAESAATSTSSPDGKGVVFATGTPVCNSMTELLHHDAVSAA